MSHFSSYLYSFSRPILLVLFATACASNPPPIMAQAQSDGSELGATIRITQANPLQAVITLKPRMTFQRIIVEIPNDIAGNKPQCKIDNAVEGQSYSCAVSGIAGPGNSALVVSISGIVGSSPQDIDWISQKKFSIPNPSYDREGAQKKQDRAEDDARLQTIRPPQ